MVVFRAFGYAFPMSIDHYAVQQAREAITATAKGMLEGHCSYIEGARSICRLLDDAKLDSFEEPFVAFVAIASQTDAVPIGLVRARWHPEAQERLAQEWADAEALAKQTGETACRDAVAWLTHHPFSVS